MKAEPGVRYFCLKHYKTECTKIAHRRSLAIFAADSGIARNSATGIIFAHFHCRKNRCSLACCDRRQKSPLRNGHVLGTCFLGVGLVPWEGWLGESEASNYFVKKSFLC